MKTRIEIDTKTFVRFWLVVFGFALIALLLYVARGALVIIGVAVFLALALSRPVGWISKRLPGNSRVGATAAAFLAVVLFIVATIFLVIPPIVEQSAKLAAAFPAWVDNAQNQWSVARGVVEKYNLQPQIDGALDSIKNYVISFASTAGQGFIASIGSVVTFIGTAVIALFIAFFMLVEGPQWMSRIWALYSDQTTMKRHKHLVRRMYNTVTGFVTGQITVSAIDGATAGLGVLVLGWFFHDVPPNIVLPIAAMSFLLSMIPMFGATIAMVLSVFLIALNSLPAAIIYAIYFVIYQQVEANVVTPMVQSKASNLTALVILVSVTTGVWMFGLAGGIIAIPIAGCIKILIEEYIEKLNRERLRNAEGVKKEQKPVLAASKQKA
mgnify:FL=1